MSGGEAGPAVDATGRPAVDPTRNVIAILEAAVQRQDDLREKDFAHLKEMATLRFQYEELLRTKETERIDAIRAVDVGAVNRAAEVAATQASALANQLIATAEASRVQVAAAASAAVTSLAAALEPIQKDIRDLRDAQSRGQGGKEQVVETRTASGSNLAVVMALVVGFSVLISLGSFVFAVTR
jgi:hypothetical protein